MGEDATLASQVEDLTARLLEIRKIKHQMCNELMGAIGHAQLLESQPELSETSRQRVGRVREHCRNLTDQAEQLSRICQMQ